MQRGLITKMTLFEEFTRTGTPNFPTGRSRFLNGKTWRSYLGTLDVGLVGPLGDWVSLVRPQFHPFPNNECFSADPHSRNGVNRPDEEGRETGDKISACVETRTVGLTVTRPLLHTGIPARLPTYFDDLRLQIPRKCYVVRRKIHGT